MTVRGLAVDVLRTAERDGRFIDDVLLAVDAPLDRRDRALLTTLVYGTTRHRLTLDAFAHAVSKRTSIDEAVRPILRTALYQILFLTRIPTHAAVNEAVELAKRDAPRAGGFVNAVLRNTQRQIGKGPHQLPRPGGIGPLAMDVQLWGRDPAERLSIAYSHPDWLVRRWLGHKWPDRRVEAICAADNEAPVITVAGSPGALKRLSDEVTTESRPSGLVAMTSMGDLSRLPDFSSGALRVQDEVAARVAPLLEPGSGRTMLDLCAAPGGKAVHLASLGATVIASDVSFEKARRMAPALRVVADGRRAPFRRAFHAVLADVPCSNTAVLGRRADARWRLKPGDVDRLRPLQVALLESASGLVAPGGRLVYSTCSLEPEENEALVAAFQSRHPEFAPGAVLRADPAGGVGGGFAQSLIFRPN